MKILVMCEGNNELKIINMLLDGGKLKFSRDDLLDMRPFQARQLSSPQIKPSLSAYHGQIMIYRVGDKMSDKLKIDREYDNIAGEEKFCTLPELEMLLIIAENLWAEYEKVKSFTRPKTFCKEHIRIGKRRYDNSSLFYEEYFSSRLPQLEYAIKEYKRLHPVHKKGEGYLADLLK